MTPTTTPTMTPTTNDGSADAPRLKHYLNLGTIGELPAWSTAPRGSPRDVLAAIKSAGFVGVQGGEASDAAAAGLAFAAGGRVDTPADADRHAAEWKDQGAVCSTIHVGNGLEDDDAIDRVIAAIVEASAKRDFPLYVEVHRATVTQDIWRTVQIARRHPGVRFNGDFSHWYTGLEMRYGDIAAKFDYAGPVFERVRFVHGRIGNGGSMQVDAGDGTAEAEASRPFVGHFRQMWTRSFAGFLANAGPGDFIAFAPELLSPKAYYARTFPGPDGEPTEETDRWRQALVYKQIAQECFDAAAARAG